MDGLNPRRLYTTIEDVPLITLFDSPVYFNTPCAVNVLLFLPSSAFSIEGTVSLALHRASVGGTSRAEVVVST